MQKNVDLNVIALTASPFVSQPVDALALKQQQAMLIVVYFLQESAMGHASSIKTQVPSHRP